MDRNFVTCQALNWLVRSIWPQPKTLEGYAETFKTKIYETVDQMITSGKPDAVCIWVENYPYHHYALQAVANELYDSELCAKSPAELDAAGFSYPSHLLNN